jgi:hypothetical protein
MSCWPRSKSGADQPNRFERLFHAQVVDFVSIEMDRTHYLVVSRYLLFHCGQKKELAGTMGKRWQRASNVRLGKRPFRGLVCHARMFDPIPLLENLAYSRHRSPVCFLVHRDSDCICPR